MITKGKTGNLYGIDVKARTKVERPRVDLKQPSDKSRAALLQAAKHCFERHHEAIQALADR